MNQSAKQNIKVLGGYSPGLKKALSLRRSAVMEAAPSPTRIQQSPARRRASERVFLSSSTLHMQLEESSEDENDQDEEMIENTRNLITFDLILSLIFLCFFGFKVYELSGEFEGLKALEYQAWLFIIVVLCFYFLEAIFYLYMRQTIVSSGLKKYRILSKYTHLWTFMLGVWGLTVGYKENIYNFGEESPAHDDLVGILRWLIWLRAYIVV